YALVVRRFRPGPTRWKLRVFDRSTTVTRYIPAGTFFLSSETAVAVTRAVSGLAVSGGGGAAVTTKTPFMVFPSPDPPYPYRPPRRQVDGERLISDELDRRLGDPRVRRLAAEREVVDIGEVVHEQLVRPRGENGDVLPTRVGQVDREARAVRADEQRQVAARAG